MKKAVILLLNFTLLLNICQIVYAEDETVQVNANSADGAYMPVEVIYHQDEARGMLSDVNELRTGGNAWVWSSDNSEKIYYSNLEELTYDYELEKAAMQRAAEIAVVASHMRPDGSECWSAYPEAFANSRKGENIAFGFSSASSVFNVWREDDEYYYGQAHRRNMLGEQFQSIGIACAEYNGWKYWVQEFSSKVVSTSPLLYGENKTSVNIPISKSDGWLNMSFADDAYQNDPYLTLEPGDEISAPAVNAAFYYQNYLYEDLGRVTNIRSDNSYVVKVKSGRLSAVNPGDAVITYKSTFGSFSSTKTLNVHVNGIGVGFYDVANPDKYYYEPVYWAYDHEPVQITTGTKPNLFAPNENVTRGQMVTFLYRLAGCPEVNASASFSDVRASAYYAKAVAWAASKGITTGYNDAANRFGPNDICTREQIVTFLWRYANQPKPSQPASFADTDSSAYYADAVSWAASNGITTGLNDGSVRFGVGEACTRAMAVTFLYRYEQKN